MWCSPFVHQVRQEGEAEGMRKVLLALLRVPELATPSRLAWARGRPLAPAASLQ